MRTEQCEDSVQDKETKRTSWTVLLGFARVKRTSDLMSRFHKGDSIVLISDFELTFTSSSSFMIFLIRARGNSCTRKSFWKEAVSVESENKEQPSDRLLSFRDGKRTTVRFLISSMTRGQKDCRVCWASLPPAPKASADIFYTAAWRTTETKH